MRTRNPSYNRAASVTQGHVGRRAGTPGPTVYDTSGNDVTSSDITFVGGTVSGDGEMAYVTVNGTGQEATNDTGADLAYGDVVVLQSDGSVTTTTTAQDTRPVGVVQVGGRDGIPVNVLFAGYVAQVNTTGTVNAGEYLETSTTAGDAQASSVRRIGSFALALAAGPNPPALMFSVPDSAGTGTGGAETPVDHGSMGATETIDAVVGTWHQGTLNANCAITVTGFTVDEAVVMIVRISQNGVGGFAITWDADVLFSGEDQPAQAATSVSWYVLWTDEGDTNIYGARVGAGATVEDLITTETDTELVLVPDGAGGVEWVAGAGGAHILLADGHATPFAFSDLLQMDDGTDFMWSDA